MPRVSPTYIGIAYYSMGYRPIHSVLVLSKYPSFDIIESCGTVIETVNGWKEQWRETGRSPAVFEPYLAFEGIIPFTAVNLPASDISQLIAGLWNVQNANRHFCDDMKHRYSDHYVQQAFINLWEREIISLPRRFNVLTSDFDNYTVYGLAQLEARRVYRPDVYHVIPLSELLKDKW
jgi:hypothetical protein